MKSARRAAFAARKNKKEKKFPNFLKLLIPAILVAIGYLIVCSGARIWDGKDKVSVVYKYDNGDIGVTVMDPVLSEVTTLVIPGDTQVDIARNYGSFRIKSVWQLGVNEKLGGNLLAETVTQNFLFPTFLWVGKPSGLDDGGSVSLINFILFPGTTNIPFGDRLQMGLFGLKVNNFGRSKIDLGKSQFLNKRKLDDGEMGYVLVGSVSQRLTVYFSDNEMGTSEVKVNITDATGTSGISEKLGEILQVIGGKVVSIDKKSVSEDIDCVISGNNSQAVKKISNLFDCKVVNTKTSFDLDIKVGREFAKRF